MKILVTSGGTKIPIDKVRDITNMSKGTFGAKIATELLQLGHDVYFFKAEGSRSPSSITIDIKDGYSLGTFQTWYNRTNKLMEHYKEMSYKTFQDYLERLERLIKIERPDVVMLAAAVSDYGVKDPFKGKIRSNDALKIELEQLPKIIYFIKEWHPTCKLVGFKLLVDSRDYQLIDAAKKSIADNKCDMIVANDLNDMKDGKHRIHLVYPDQHVLSFETDPDDSNFLARKVAEETIRL